MDQRGTQSYSRKFLHLPPKVFHNILWGLGLQRKIQKTLEPLKYFEKLYNENNGVYAYWGEWHTHPEDIPHYSIIDLKNWKRIGKEDPKGVQYHIIAGRKAFSIWRMQKGKLCPKKICEVKWNEINL